MPSSLDNELILKDVGIGLRPQHYQTILADLPKVPWFEALTDNYMNDGGLPLHYLQLIRSHYPISFHGVGLSIGSSDPLDPQYLQRLKSLIDRFQPAHISDHLCWSAINGLHGNDLFPIPYTQEAIKHVAQRIDAVQNFLGQRILIENVSSYLSYQESEMSEAEFLAEVLVEADCYLLCDVNNIYVSAVNHGISAQDYLQHLPAERVKEMHLAGFEDQGDYLLDTHGEAVHEPVWALYQLALERFGSVPALIEWDTNIPDFEVLEAERDKAQAMMEAQHAKVRT